MCRSRAKEARKIVESLGPAYVKIGQTLSTRVDILPAAYIAELERLQDNVPVFHTTEARRVLEEGEWAGSAAGCALQGMPCCSAYCKAVVQPMSNTPAPGVTAVV